MKNHNKANHNCYNNRVYSLSLMLLGLFASPLYAASTTGLNQSPSKQTALSRFVSSWSGSFDTRRIGFFIESIQQGQVRGYSIVGANKQGFVGTIQPEGNNKQNNKYKIIARETGKPESAGVFELHLDLSKPKSIEGSWQANKAGIQPKFFELAPQQCRYQMNVGEFPEASQRLLKDSDLQISRQELQYMRNEIYARHNYSFSNKVIASLFSDKDWYIPCSLNVEQQLSKIERENIKRIKLMEPYAENVELDWGR
ncbi:YARHG domain-containing protein [Alkanindiges illinoisensis]|uniref:YARHG domain-containing protein n=1 Tax=Alkanindiges illinoisensis TaxID=197183 RepID=A0A4Y7X9X6_9GAMM|nr:YARHG domain-containing protein [Alkanindiges illinoisensis]TEU23873.1 YARHG domain-containing protein [Alkanindiges illinoisensis]